MRPTIAAGLLALLLCSLAAADLRISAQAPNAQPQPSADPWQFAEDEERVPSWQEAVRTQAVDLVLFGAFVSLALVSFFRKSVPLKYVTLAASVGYLGVAKAQLISIVNVFGVLSWNLPIFRFNLAWYFFAGFTVLSTVLWGRLYCGRICAFGSLTQLLDTIVPSKLRREPPPWVERRASTVKYGLLAGTIAYFVLTRDASIYRYVEPFWMFTGHGTTGTWIGLGSSFWRRSSSEICTAVSCARLARSSACCPMRPCFASNDGRNARPARFARRRASGERFADHRLS